MENLQYTGKRQPTPQEKVKDGILPYIPDELLIEAVNLSIVLQRPLLLMGEPGCGKTMLSHHVAFELGLNLYSYSVRSSSNLNEDIYTYDALMRLHDAELVRQKIKTDEKDLKKVNDSKNYIKYSELGKGFFTPQDSVILIDEIDKADIDFSDDLLGMLEKKPFYIKELNGVKKIKGNKIVFITSNKEKDLSDAFLRRCIFHYIHFPQNEHLYTIMKAHFPDVNEAIIKIIIKFFNKIRNKDLEKKPSTSEFIDWLRVLTACHTDDEIIDILGNDETIKYSGTLFKKKNDLDK